MIMRFAGAPRPCVELQRRIMHDDTCWGCARALSGVSMRTFGPKAKNALSKMPPTGLETDRLHFLNIITACDAASFLAQGKIDNPATPLGDIRSKVVSLEQLGYTVPEYHHVLISRRSSQQLHYEGKVNE